MRGERLVRGLGCRTIGGGRDGAGGGGVGVNVRVGVGATQVPVDVGVADGRLWG